MDIPQLQPLVYNFEEEDIVDFGFSCSVEDSDEEALPQDPMF
jgi:hypothetical protein